MNVLVFLNYCSEIGVNSIFLILNLLLAFRALMDDWKQRLAEFEAPEISKSLRENRVDPFFYKFALSFLYVPLTASDTTLVSDSIGMKLVSPCHLGTM